VLHSLTKYLGGHIDVVGGALIGNDAKLREELAFFQNAVGGTPGRWTASSCCAAIKTLHVRMERHCTNALALARWLEKPSAGRARDLPGPRVAPAARARRSVR
jgi:cystathionine beta-lyase/cystathionine gamma-synthase